MQSQPSDAVWINSGCILLHCCRITAPSCFQGSGQLVKAKSVPSKKPVNTQYIDLGEFLFFQAIASNCMLAATVCSLFF